MPEGLGHTDDIQRGHARDVRAVDNVQVGDQVPGIPASVFFTGMFQGVQGHTHGCITNGMDVDLKQLLVCRCKERIQ